MYADEPEQPLECDVFRFVDKNIKSFYKRIIARDKQKGRGKLPKTDDTSDFEWSDVIDPLKLTEDKAEITYKTIEFDDSSKHTSSVKIIKLKEGPDGFYILPGLLPPESQLYWARKALCEYSLEDYTNLTNLGKTADEITSWAAASSGTANFQDFLKLRWSCLGYHYDWTARKYEKNLKSVFPPDFAQLCKNIAHLVDLDFEPEAAIVNYYPVSASMGGHLDDAEHTMVKPIVSLSLGCSALFLLGGVTKSYAKPLPVLLRSGDVIIMSGESRRCYHGVPCIFPQSFSCLVDDTDGQNDGASSLLRHGSVACSGTLLSKDDQRVVDLLREARLNMNVRQVRVNATATVAVGSDGALGINNSTFSSGSDVEGELVVDDDGWLDKTGTGHVKLPPVVRS